LNFAGEHCINEVLGNVEDQTVAGRWRALTKTYLQGAASESRNKITQYIIQRLSDIILCTGAISEFPNAFNYIEKEDGSRIAAVVDLALQLNEHIGSGITSSDLSIFSGEARESFDSDMMEDYYRQGQGNKNDQSRILGGAELGLMKTTIKTSATGGSQYTKKVLLKAKVVLESTLQAPVWKD
jgi:hypothetical protein